MLGHTYELKNLYWSEKRGMVNAHESTTMPGWMHYSGEFTMGASTKYLFDQEFRPIHVEPLTGRLILKHNPPEHKFPEAARYTETLSEGQSNSLDVRIYAAAHFYGKRNPSNMVWSIPNNLLCNMMREFLNEEIKRIQAKD